MEAGVEQIRPGVTVSEVVAAMDAPFVARGLEEYTQPPFMRVRGHGMGFGSVAPGDFLRRNTLELVERRHLRAPPQPDAAGRRLPHVR